MGNSVEKVLCGDQWLSLVEGKHGSQTVSYVRAGNEILLVPLTASGNVLFTVEPSPAMGRDVLILPGGQFEPGESAREAGNRELQEEVGCRAARLDFLAELHPWSKYLTTRSFVYLARDLTPATLQGDEGYAIGVEKAPLASFEQLIAAGRLYDARMIAALYLALRFLQREQHAAGQATP